MEHLLNPILIAIIAAALMGWCLISLATKEDDE